jgi:pimeloyl-ACP methyl ester carboxylesterase
MLRIIAMAVVATGMAVGSVPVLGSGLPRPHDYFANIDPSCAATITLPEPTGPHQVGTSTYVFVDAKRPEVVTPDDAHDLHQVLFQVFYPGLRSADVPSVPYMPELELLVAGFLTDARQGAQALGADLMAAACVLPHAFPDIDLSDIEQRYPLLIFSSGGNMSRHWYTGLATEVASQGYVVAVLSHAYNGMELFPYNGHTMSADYWRLPAEATDEQVLAKDREQADYLAGDALFVLDTLTDYGAPDSGHRFAGRLDLERVAIAGHSRGGSTVARSCSTDPRFDACLILDNIGPYQERDDGLDTPQVLIRSPWNDGRVDLARAFLSLNSVHAYDIVIDEANHFTFSDLPLVDPENYPSDVDPVRGFEIVVEVVLAYLDWQLRDDRSRFNALENEPGPVSIEAVVKPSQ